MTRVLPAILFLSLVAAAPPAGPGAAHPMAPPVNRDSVFARSNLVAWCIVPFDAKQRGPKARAQMLARLGVRRVAYDWRDEHVKEWDEELTQYKAHGIELVAFWAPARHDEILALFKRHDLKPQLWVDGPGGNEGQAQSQRVETAAAALLPLARKAKDAGCTVGLYNHGGWFGEPENQIAIIERLRQDGADNVGIVYNLHHGESHVERFPQLLAKMKPHLLCLNLNGMRKGGPKILPLGQGDDDLRLLRAIRDSGYRGPIGILNHRHEIDAEQGLTENIDGMKRLLVEMKDEQALRTYSGITVRGNESRRSAAR
jgi:sugar phosphate isomerase/epimerase